MTDKADELDDWITSSMLAGSDGLYFVGTFERRITFYSQQVRAFRLVRALHEKGRLKATDSVAVVGAGAAGVTCALALATLGYQVTLFDPADQVLQLQSASPRLLHPHIYEWPALGSLDRSAGLPLLDWTLGEGGPVTAQLVAEFQSHKARLPNLIAKMRYRLESLAREGSDWRLRFTNGDSKIVQQIVLAIGFGDERTAGAAATYDYWKERGVGTAAVEPNAPATYLVSGNGDGALTDILNLMIKDFEHVAFTESFLGYFGSDVLRATVLKAYEGLDTESDLEPAFKRELRETLSERGVLDRLEPHLRHDRNLTVNCDGHLLSVGKAAQLNQCMVFAVLEAAKQAGILVRRTKGKIIDVVKHADGLEPVGVAVNGKTLSDHFQNVILRHGPNKRERYHPAEAQFDGFEKASSERFKRRPELLVPPTLDPDTYSMFYELRLEKLSDAATRLQLGGQTAREASTIVVTWDPATQRLAQRGKVALADLMKQCEIAPAPIVVQLDVPPDRLDADNLVRLANASGGKIVLNVGATVHAAWKAKLPNVPISAAASSRYPYCTVDASSIGGYVDASLLRQLDKLLANTKTIGTCYTLGKIAPDVMQEALVTWGDWRTLLDSSPALRSDFLAWLGSIGPTMARAWNGDCGVLDGMASALILMLATHIGEPLQPASVPRGNLRFSTDGRALGSAAVKVDDGGLLTDWDLPDHWDVDALILSGSSEVMVADPDDTVLNAGDPGIGLGVARRVKPAIVRNDADWRVALRSSLPIWKDAVEEEFRRWRERQDNEREKVLA